MHFYTLLLQWKKLSIWTILCGKFSHCIIKWGRNVWSCINSYENCQLTNEWCPLNPEHTLGNMWKNKPTQWGFKFWVIADSTGYTTNFNLYCGKQRTDLSLISGHGLSYDVVKELLPAYHHQGYYIFLDNFYTSPTLVDYLGVGIRATGTLRTNRKNVPKEVQELQAALKRKSVPRGTGYYIRLPSSSSVFVCWRDNDCVTMDV